MKQHLHYVALIVANYDDAIAYFTKTLEFELIEDRKLTSEKRWVVVAPPGSVETRLLLAKASSDDQRQAIGNQAGGRVFLFLHTDDFDHDYRKLLARGVDFIEKPRDEPYGKVAVFNDIFGNKWDLLQLRP
ncbi:MAG: VOC family protein [Geminicoccales bacterium]